MTTWLQHVKKVHAAGSTSFKESLKRASVSWKKQKGKKGAAKASTAEPEAAAAPRKKKRRKRVKKSMPKMPAEVYKSVDSRNL